MKQLRLYIYAVVLSLTLVACNEESDNISNSSYSPLTAEDFLPSSSNVNANDPSIDPAVSRLEFPHIQSSGTQVLVNRTGETVNYCVEWDTEKMSQLYSCYQMDQAYGAVRTSRYYPSGGGELQYPFDDRVSNYFGHNDPFYSTGYDHGHICPSADRLYSAAANKQTFLLTNMQPQVNGFNAGVWENMESQVREWNKNGFRNKLFIVKGGTISNTEAVPNAYETKARTGGDLIIPNYFFMAVLCNTPNDGYKAMGFWIEHKAGTDKGAALAKYMVNIDELERLTGIDFFCNLPDNIEEQVESADLTEVKKVWPLAS